MNKLLLCLIFLPSIQYAMMQPAMTDESVAHSDRVAHFQQFKSVALWIHYWQEETDLMLNTTFQTDPEIQKLNCILLETGFVLVRDWSNQDVVKINLLLKTMMGEIDTYFSETPNLANFLKCKRIKILVGIDNISLIEFFEVQTQNVADAAIAEKPADDELMEIDELSQESFITHYEEWMEWLLENDDYEDALRATYDIAKEWQALGRETKDRILLLDYNNHQTILGYFDSVDKLSDMLDNLEASASAVKVFSLNFNAWKDVCTQWSPTIRLWNSEEIAYTQTIIKQWQSLPDQCRWAIFFMFNDLMKPILSSFDTINTL